MAFRKSQSQEPLKVILRVDDALDVGDPEEFDELYESYLLDLDESKLPIIEGAEPTRFVLSRSFNWDTGKRVKNEQIKQGKKGRVEIQAGHYMEEVRYALTGIENPKGCDDPLIWEADPVFKGRTHIKVMEALSDGLIQDLYAARNNAMKRSVPQNLKKSSKPSSNSRSQITVNS